MQYISNNLTVFIPVVVDLLCTDNDRILKYTGVDPNKSTPRDTYQNTFNKIIIITNHLGIYSTFVFFITF